MDDDVAGDLPTAVVITDIWEIAWAFTHVFPGRIDLVRTVRTDESGMPGPDDIGDVDLVVVGGHAAGRMHQAVVDAFAGLPHPLPWVAIWDTWGVGSRVHDVHIALDPQAVVSCLAEPLVDPVSLYAVADRARTRRRTG